MSVCLRGLSGLRGCFLFPPASVIPTKGTLRSLRPPRFFLCHRGHRDLSQTRPFGYIITRMQRHLLIAVGLAAAVSLAAQQRAPQNDSIRQDDLRADLFFLAGDSLRGRLTDTEENRAAADFIRSRFERMGLKGAGPNGSFFQAYNLMTATSGDPVMNRLELTAEEGGVRQYRSGQDFYPLRFSGSGNASGAVVFCGFGISAAPLGYDDYNGVLRGKVVLVLDHEPGERDPNSPFDGVVTSEFSTGWRKALAAQEHGAVAVLFVSDVHNH